MMTRTKIALAAALFAATSSVAVAQGFDPNMANRYPSYADPIAKQPVVAQQGTPHFGTHSGLVGKAVRHRPR